MPLRILADLGQLKQIRSYVTQTATALGARAEVLEDLRLAVDEAATNILTHGYGGCGRIELEVAAAGKDLVVTLRDEAPAFDPTLAPPAELRLPGERDAAGGFGVYLMHSGMDEITHQPLEDGNELTMIKRDAIAGG